MNNFGFEIENGRINTLGLVRKWYLLSLNIRVRKDKTQFKY